MIWPKIFSRAMIKGDYSLYTFITSLAVLVLQIEQMKRGVDVVPPIVTVSSTSWRGRKNQSHIDGEYGPLYADFEFPHPSYVNVSHHDIPQAPLDLSAELAKLRIAANTQRAILTAASRMPPETHVSRMIAERTRGYLREDAKQGVQSNVNSMHADTETLPFTSINELWKYVARTHNNQIGVILGVGPGDNLIPLLHEWKATFLYLVDPYIHIWRGYDRPSNIDDKNHQLIFEGLRQRLSYEFEGKFMFIRDFSIEFASTYKNAKGAPSPGFVLVDANPSYRTVKDDIEAWFPLLAAGGLMAGTLYHNEGKSIEVRRAVDEFARSRNVKVHVFDDSMWAIQK